MVCKDCIHAGLCYKENEYENFPDRCGDFSAENELMNFAKFVTKEVLDDNFKENADSFAELACRKLVKLDLVKLDGDTYKEVENE